MPHATKSQDSSRNPKPNAQGIAAHRYGQVNKTTKRTDTRTTKEIL